jgi:hypothetical protein
VKGFNRKQRFSTAWRYAALRWLKFVTAQFKQWKYELRNGNSTKFNSSTSCKSITLRVLKQRYAITRHLFYSKIFSLDIHKKLDSFYSNRFIFSQDLFASMQRICTNMWTNISNHAVDLVMKEVVLCSHLIFLNLGWNVLVVNPRCKTKIKSAIKNRCLEKTCPIN